MNAIAKYRHEMQPYGWVEMVDCEVVVRGESRYDYSRPTYERGVSGYATVVDQVTYVRGTVVASSYCGALLCGVPVVKATSDRYPVGSTYECRINYPSDLQRGVTIDVAM